MKKIIVLIAATALMLSYCIAGAEDIISGAGASFATPVYQAWAYDYNKTVGPKLNYQSIGSGGGIRQILERTVDLGASDEPMTPGQLKKNNLLQFPTLIGGVVLAVNVEGIKEGRMRLDPDTVCRIYLGEITYWDDPRLKKLNPSLQLPHSGLSVVYRADASGSTAIFTNYLARICPDFKARVGQGTSVKWPVGIGGKGNEGVTNYIMRSSNSIGYVQFAYARQNKLNYVQMKNRAGNFVAPALETFEAAARSGNFDSRKDFYIWFTNTAGKRAWPITGATFILLARDRNDAALKAVKFFDWAFKTGDTKASELSYLPLPKAVKKEVRAYWKANGIY